MFGVVINFDPCGCKSFRFIIWRLVLEIHFGVCRDV